MGIFGISFSEVRRVHLQFIMDYSKGKLKNEEIKRTIIKQLKKIFFLQNPKNRPLADNSYKLLDSYIKSYQEIENERGIKIKKGLFGGYK